MSELIDKLLNGDTSPELAEQVFREANAAYGMMTGEVPPVHTSMDAALDLLHACFPGWTWDHLGGEVSRVSISGPNRFDPDQISGWAVSRNSTVSPAALMCACILKTLKERNSK